MNKESVQDDINAESFILHIILHIHNLMDECTHIQLNLIMQTYMLNFIWDICETIWFQITGRKLLYLAQRWAVLA